MLMSSASAFVVLQPPSLTAPTQQHQQHQQRLPKPAETAAERGWARRASRARGAPSPPGVKMSSTAAEVVDASVVGDEFEAKTNLLRQIDLSSSKRMRWVDVGVFPTRRQSLGALHLCVACLRGPGRDVKPRLGCAGWRLHLNADFCIMTCSVVSGLHACRNLVTFCTRVPSESGSPMVLSSLTECASVNDGKIGFIISAENSVASPARAGSVIDPNTLWRPAWLFIPKNNQAASLALFRALNPRSQRVQSSKLIKDRPCHTSGLWT